MLTPAASYPCYHIGCEKPAWWRAIVIIFPPETGFGETYAEHATRKFACAKHKEHATPGEIVTDDLWSNIAEIFIRFCGKPPVREECELEFRPVTAPRRTNDHGRSERHVPAVPKASDGFTQDPEPPDADQ